MDIISYLLEEAKAHGRIASSIKPPEDEKEAFKLYRRLANQRPPSPLSEEVLALDDAYLEKVHRHRLSVGLEEMTPVAKDTYLYEGDITTLTVDGIVNAANSSLLGCFIPHHTCIDNAIHTYSGLRLRLACAEIRQKLGRQAHTGEAFITKAYHLPSQYVLHTVGPIVEDRPTSQHEALLAEAYAACYALAYENGLQSLAFCALSTGVFRFPLQHATDIALATIDACRQSDGPVIVWNVFSPRDRLVYEKTLERKFYDRQ